MLNSKTLKDVKIRLYGIDTPEKEQAFSKRARPFTSKTVYGKVVEVKVMAIFFWIVYLGRRRELIWCP